MASYLISDAPYAKWISDVLATLEEHKITKIAVAAPLPTGDATLDAICANGKRIQQAWEDAAEEDEED